MAVIAETIVILQLNSSLASLIRKCLFAEMILLGFPRRAAGFLKLRCVSLSLWICAYVLAEFAESGGSPAFKTALILAVMFERSAVGQEHTFINNFIEAIVLISHSAG